MKRILLVEDDASLRKVLCDLLGELNCEIVQAEDGAVAINALKNGRFDLVISDIMMPKVTGLELLKWVQQQEKKTPVLLITGFSELYETSVAMSMGALGFLPKPFSKTHLFDHIKAAFSQDDSPKEEVNLDDKYYKISIDDFVTGSLINIDISIRLSASKYVTIAHTGEDISPEQIENYKKKGITHLYVTSENFKKYMGFGTSLSKVVTSNSKIDHNRKVNLLRHTSEIITQHFYCGEIDKEALSHAKSAVETSVSLLAESTDAFKLMESLSQSSDSIYAHSVGVSFNSALIAKKLKWQSTLTLIKLSLAGLLHDIGKKELPKELLAKSRAELSPAEIALLESHATRGMEILAQIRDIPSDVVQVALQHHENAIGTGYPYRLKPNKTHPLARAVAVADEFCYLTLPSLDKPGLPAKEALQRLIMFQTEKLDPHALSALFLVYNVAPPAQLLEKAKNSAFQKSAA